MDVDAVPAGHKVQLGCPAAAAYEPAGQLEQAVEPLAEKEPAVQLEQLVPTLFAPYVPAAHGIVGQTELLAKGMPLYASALHAVPDTPPTLQVTSIALCPPHANGV